MKSKKFSNADTSDFIGRDSFPKIRFKKRDFRFSSKQHGVLDVISNEESNVIFINGPAGCTKTYLAVYAALQLLDRKHIEDIMYIRTVVESGDRSVGTLPGNKDEKLEPYSMPLHDKLIELLDPSSYINVTSCVGLIETMPVNYVRGGNWINKFVIFDEAQNATFKELTTALTRLGKNSKIIVCGDTMQSDIYGKSGFADMMRLFSNPEAGDHGIHSFEFTEDDIKRSELVKYIVKTISSQN